MTETWLILIKLVLSEACSCFKRIVSRKKQIKIKTKYNPVKMLPLQIELAHGFSFKYTEKVNGTEK